MVKLALVPSLMLHDYIPTIRSGFRDSAGGIAQRELWSSWVSISTVILP